eukprot:3532810-Rhodomonas_salina.5
MLGTSTAPPTPRCTLGSTLGTSVHAEARLVAHAYAHAASVLDIACAHAVSVPDPMHTPILTPYDT